MAKEVEPNVPFIEARNFGTSQKPTAIVLNISHTTSEQGAALAIAKYHHSINSPAVSHHYIVDESKIYRCVSDFFAAASCPYKAISVLVCSEPDKYSSYALDNAADLVASLLVIHKIPVRYLDSELEEKWLNHKWRRRGGLIVRAVDTWPYDIFLSLVNMHLFEDYNK